MNRTDNTRSDYAGPCARCGGPVPNNTYAGQYPGALSRYDGETYICSACGTDEALKMGELTPFRIPLHSLEAEMIRNAAVARGAGSELKAAYFDESFTTDDGEYYLTIALSSGGHIPQNGLSAKFYASEEDARAAVLVVNTTVFGISPQQAEHIVTASMFGPKAAQNLAYRDRAKRRTS